MKSLCPLLFVFFLIYWSCSDTIPPTVTISSHTSGQTVNKIVPIKVTTQDNEEISKVEFFIDDSLVLTDTQMPFEGYWNTSQYVDGSEHIAKVISYDISDNATESQPISLIFDNSEFNPTPSVLYQILYYDGFQINWSQNNDDDFGFYKLYESFSEDMNNQTLVYETSEREDTNYVETGISDDRYYQITCEDIWGLQSISDIEVLLTQVELWGEYYSVENTTELNLYNNNLTGPIPSEIGNLTNLSILYLNDNELYGQIPDSICGLDFRWDINDDDFVITNNQLSPPYPECLSEWFIGVQDTTNCN